MADSGSTKAVLAALAANITVAILKFAAFLLTGSSSMLAESFHSVADSGNQVLLLIGGKRAKRSASAEHPFGYGRERYIYSFLVAIVLFSLGGLFSLYEAYEKWQNPHPIEGFWWWLPLVVLIGAIIAESFSLRTAVRQSDRRRGGHGWFAFIRRTKSSELPVILLEDFAALTGLTFAFLAVSATLLTGNSLWDAIGTAMIGLLLVAVAILLAIETKSLLLGEAASEEHQRKIEEALKGPGGIPILQLKTLHMGPEELLVAARIQVSHSESAADVAGQIRSAEQRIRDAVPIAKTIFVEPDIQPAPQEATAEGTSG